MRNFLLAGVSVLGLVSPAVAGVEFFSSTAGSTDFEAPTVIACSDREDRVIRYNTTFNGIPYEGYLWVQSVSGCNTSRVSVQGYFEEQNLSQNQWCKGSLALRFNGSRGVAQWQSVNAQPGYRCDGSGQLFTLQLVQTGP